MNIVTMVDKLDIVDGIEYRSARPHELLEWERMVARGFGDHFRSLPDELEFYREKIDFSRSLCAFDDGEMVGSTFSVGYKGALPGGVALDLGGVTAVVVSATHRRRGILTEMMRRLLRNEYELGVPLAGLWASQSIIYGRFGYGISVQQSSVKIATRHSAFRHMPRASGKIRFVDAGHIREIGPGVWDSAMELHPGMVTRVGMEWDRGFRDISRDPWSKEEPFFIVYEEGGGALGYAKYRMFHKDTDDDEGIELRVNELVAANAVVEVALWRFILDIDLVHTVVHSMHPHRTILTWLLRDSRKLSLEPYDALWLRILDPAAALSGRRYSASGSISIRLVDDFCPWVNGVYRLEADGDGVGSCVRVDGVSADVTMPAATLASIYMGEHYLAHLKSASRVDEHKPGAVGLADMMFSTSDVHYVVHDF